MFFFFFQAEDGIRDVAVTGVQTCALPISSRPNALTDLRVEMKFGVYRPWYPETASSPARVGSSAIRQATAPAFCVPSAAPASRPRLAFRVCRLGPEVLVAREGSRLNCNLVPLST